MKIVIKKDAEKALVMAKEALISLFKNDPNKSVSPILFLVSGGSAFSLLDSSIIQCLGSHVTISVLDERFDDDPGINNFAQLMSLPFYVEAVEKGCSFIDTRVQRGESIQDLTERFEKELKKWKHSHQNGVVVITQGIGPDGHTAGIMPFLLDVERFNKLFNTDRWVVGYDAGNKNEYPFRVTVTNAFLKEMVDHSIVYAVGTSKKAPLEKAFSQDTRNADVPATIISKMKDVTVFSDQSF